MGTTGWDSDLPGSNNKQRARAKCLQILCFCLEYLMDTLLYICASISGFLNTTHSLCAALSGLLLHDADAMGRCISQILVLWRSARCELRGFSSVLALIPWGRSPEEPLRVPFRYLIRGPRTGPTVHPHFCKRKHTHTHSVVREALVPRLQRQIIESAPTSSGWQVRILKWPTGSPRPGQEPPATGFSRPCPSAVMWTAATMRR